MQMLQAAAPVHQMSKEALATIPGIYLALASRDTPTTPANC